jgi:hypothetical protein
MPSSVPDRTGSLLSFDAAPRALCLAVALAAFPANLVLIDAITCGYPFGLAAIAGTRSFERRTENAWPTR